MQVLLSWTPCRVTRSQLPGLYVPPTAVNAVEISRGLRRQPVVVEH